MLSQEEKYENIKNAINFCIKAHNDQFDKGHQPYWLHPIAVMSTLSRPGMHPTSASYDSDWMHMAQITSLFHDIPEDTQYTIDYIIDNNIVELNPRGETWLALALTLLTHDKQQAHHLYIKNIVDNYHLDAGISLFVKKADIHHNTLPMRQLCLPLEDQVRLRQKYMIATQLIEQGIEEFEEEYVNDSIQ